MHTFKFFNLRNFYRNCYFFNYTHTNLENVFQKLYSYICYLYNVIKISRIHIIVFVIPTFIYTYLA